MSDWSDRAAAWAEHWGRLAAPARVAVLDATGVRAGTRLLDVGCGSGELCALAVERGAHVTGIDAAESMVAIARSRVPGADLRVGPLETLPWDDGAFDVVTAINALQFADDFVAALREAARVTRGLVAVCNWGRRADRELFEVYEAIAPPDDDASPRAEDAGDAPTPPAVGEPGVLEDLARAAGLDPVAAAEVDTPWEAPDLATLVHAIVAGAGFEARPEQIERAAAAFRRPDGSYRFQNRFRYVVARAPRPPGSARARPPATP